MLDLAAAFATFPVLDTERLILREITEDDAPAIFRIMGDPRVMQYFGQLPMETLDEAVQRAHGIRAAFKKRTGVRWAITDREHGQFLGSCGFWRLIEPHYRAEIGYELAPEWWGRGVMAEALTAVITFGFTVIGLHSVEAQIHPANRGSQRVLEKVGFVQEGYFHENYFDPVVAEFTDTAVFSLLKTSWLVSGRSQ